MLPTLLLACRPAALVFLVCFLKMLVDYVLAAIVHLIRCTWIWKRHIAGSLNLLPSCKTTKQTISLLIRTAFPAMILYITLFDLQKNETSQIIESLMLTSIVVVSIDKPCSSLGISNQGWKYALSLFGNLIQANAEMQGKARTLVCYTV